MKNTNRVLDYTIVAFILGCCFTNNSMKAADFSLGAAMGRATQASRGTSLRSRIPRKAKGLAIPRQEFVDMREEVQQLYNAFNKKHPAPRRPGIDYPPVLDAKYGFARNQFRRVVKSAKRVNENRKVETLTSFDTIYHSALRHVLMEEILNFLITYSADADRLVKREQLDNGMATTRSRLLTEADRVTMRTENLQNAIFRFTDSMGSVIIPALTRSLFGKLRAYFGYVGMAGIPLLTMTAIAAYVKRKQISEYVTEKAVKPIKDYFEKETISESILKVLEKAEVEKTTKEGWKGFLRGSGEHRTSLINEIREHKKKLKDSDLSKEDRENLETELHVKEEQLKELETPLGETLVRTGIQEGVTQVAKPGGIRQFVEGAFSAHRQYKKEKQKEGLLNEIKVLNKKLEVGGLSANGQSATESELKEKLEQLKKLETPTAIRSAIHEGVPR